MEHADYIARFRPPVAAREAPRPELKWSRRGEGRIRSAVGHARRAVHGRRLAYLDSHFPWRENGSRYADALAFHEERPDTVFFSMYEMRDSFPAPVLPLAEFPRLAPSLGITDVYGAFQCFMAGILGLRGSERRPFATQGLNLAGVLRRDGIRAHASLDPDGALAAIQAGLDEARRLVDTADRVFSWDERVLACVPGVIPVNPALVDTAFYVVAERDFRSRPLQLLFASEAGSRDGLQVALGALSELKGEPVHLHVVGPCDMPISAELSGQTTVHGALAGKDLRALHRRCHVFLSPSGSEAVTDAAGDVSIPSGFPGPATAQALSGGLLLLGANPNQDHRHLRPGTDYIELAPGESAFAEGVRSALGDPDGAACIAASGAHRARERLDARASAAVRLQLMGFGGGRTPYQPEPAAPPEASRGGSGRGRRRSRIVELLEQQQAGLDALTADVRALRSSLEEVRAEQRRVTEAEETSRRSLMEVGQLILDDESGARRALQAARESPDYEAPFVAENPLVSVCIPTYKNHVRLFERSIPSVLAQDHANIEVVVIGDCAPPETARGIERLGDPRVRYENLSLRGPYPQDAHLLWLVAGTGPLNRAFELARGEWIAVNNDDDVLRLDHVSSLLAHVQRSREEVVYGRFEYHQPDGSTITLGEWPPSWGQFAWQAALQHRAMRLFDYRLSAALFNHPGDWDRARRMLRAGVRFGMIDKVVCDYRPTRPWGTQG